MIQVKSVTKTYSNKAGTVLALDRVNLHIEKGDIYGVVGYSGSGKSTLIRCINRLEEIDSGSIIVAGDNIEKLRGKELMQKRQKIGMIFQHFNLLKNDTVYQNIALPLKYAKRPKAEIDRKVSELLETVGLTDKRDVHPAHLSGGQKQRVAIARALASDPEVLLCDEATSALDPDTTHSVLHLLKELRNTLGLTILLITHEMSVVKDICNKVALLSAGRVVEQGSTLDLFTKPEHEVTKQFIRSSSEEERLQMILDSDHVRVALDGGGKIYRIVYQSNEVNDALLSEISRTFDVKASIVYGNIQLINGTALGELYVSLNGDKKNILRATDYIQERPGVVTELVPIHAPVKKLALTEESVTERRIG